MLQWGTCVIRTTSMWVGRVVSGWMSGGVTRTKSGSTAMLLLA